MIGKGTAISSTKAAIGYGNDHEKGAETVYSHLITGEHPDEIAKEFRAIQSLNDNCQRNTFSFVLSPTVEDGKTLDNKALGHIASKFLEDMKLADRQAIAFVHHDKAHKHIHLYVNRIDLNGKAYNDSFIGKRSQLAAERVAKDLGLQTVKDIRQQRLLQLKSIRTEIKTIHSEVLLKHKPKSIDSYMKLMQEKEVKVVPYINKSNQLQGFRFEFKGHNLKASEVHRSLSGGRLIQSLNAQTYKSILDKKDNSILIQGSKLALSGNLLQSLTKKVLKQAIKKVIETGIGI
ncbi:relaxase/mobilization nuclease domain-containing protein [Formosa haliotis]|uniref:relaxase/mobilization nuclease domain-containing protein n=1 Tax=Formosa haliotis TaxID=1555194 RepID=UPI000824B5DA|nr:relaxase/mobilization nuclease domain-containing protein [Formosa haliotis]